MPARIGKAHYYWDACAFIHWLKGVEIKDRPDILTAMRKIEDLVDNQKISLSTSVLTKLEVTESKMEAGDRRRWERLFSLPNVNMVGIDSRIIDLAAEIRAYHREQSGNTLQTPDAIHLATAVHYEADCFHTMDGMGKRRAGALIGLSGNLCDGTYPLRIEVPSTRQLSMLFSEQANLVDFDKAVRAGKKKKS